jgi:hypothetical protein
MEKWLWLQTVLTAPLRLAKEGMERFIEEVASIKTKDYECCKSKKIEDVIPHIYML